MLGSNQLTPDEWKIAMKDNSFIRWDLAEDAFEIEDLAIAREPRDFALGEFARQLRIFIHWATFKYGAYMWPSVEIYGSFDEDEKIVTDAAEIAFDSIIDAFSEKQGLARIAVKTTCYYLHTELKRGRKKNAPKHAFQAKFESYVDQHMKFKSLCFRQLDNEQIVLPIFKEMVRLNAETNFWGHRIIDRNTESMYTQLKTFEKLVQLNTTNARKMKKTFAEESTRKRIL